MKLEMKRLTKRYGQICALDQFSYTFSKGIYGLLGANGGKKYTDENDRGYDTEKWRLNLF